MRHRYLPVFALIASLAAASSASGQGTTGSINATATVVASLTVSGTDLAFGNIAPTSFKTVAPASGGTFTVSGAASQPVSVSFALPTTLGVASVAIGNWTGLSNTTNTTAGAAAMTPSATAQTLTIGAGGSLFLWIGAKVTTTAAPVGSRSAPITLTVVYN
jgi:hypothetical protein